jgi:hypothetical protein
MTDRFVSQSSAAAPAGDVVLTMRFSPCASPGLVDVEVTGEDELTSDRLLKIVDAAALRLTVFAAEYRMAALLDCIARGCPSGPRRKTCGSVGYLPVRRDSRVSKSRSPEAAHLAGGAKQDKGERSPASSQRST